MWRVVRVRTLRVLFFKNAIGEIDGAAEVLFSAAVAAQQLGHEVSVLVVYPCAADNPYRVRLSARGVQVRSLQDQPQLRAIRKLLDAMPTPFRRGWTRLLGLALRAWLRFERIDLVHAILDPATPLALSAVPPDRLIVHEVSNPRFGTHFSATYDELARRPLQRLPAVILQSPKIEALFQSRVPFAGRTFVVPTSTDSSPLLRPVRDQASATVTFGFASRIEESKGIRTLFEAFSRVVRRSPQVRLRVAGDGPERAWLAQAVSSEYGGVITLLPPYRSQQGRDAFLESIDVLVLPSISEGSPTIVIEALAMGRPTIGSDVGGMSDLLADGAGVLVPPGDVRALELAMEAVSSAEERLTELSHRARARFELVHSRAAAARALEGAYADNARVRA